MSLKKKIALGFFISAFIIAILAVFMYVNFIEIRKEIRYLEVTDTFTRKSLQLRRHEKNYFLYSPQKADEESQTVHAYIKELKGILEQHPNMEKVDTEALRSYIAEYEQRFNKIESSVKRLTAAFGRTKDEHMQHALFISLAELAFIEKPSQTAIFLSKVISFPAGHELTDGLRKLEMEITTLRKTGESIVETAKDLDKAAREKVDSVIHDSQIAIVVIFPLFFAVGIGTLFFISRSVSRRLMLLISVVEKTGMGSFPHVAAPERKWGNDEVGLLIRKFDHMEDLLAERAAEIDRKNKELIQVKKLAAIGTLAAGVAHELNNPLNNIHLSAQVLAKQAGESGSPVVLEAVSDILGQTARVKRIVSELLEFARGREPRLQKVDLCELMGGVYKKLTVDTAKVRFSLDCGTEPIVLAADPEQMEQVFINLFTNAVEAMPDGGDLAASVRAADGAVVITVADSGKGIAKESLDKVFEPFFTTKDKGTGLGLAIVFNIIRKHYGEIAVGSEEGKGTTFTITMPREV
jgi:two-component system, NtrC family, sensor kinase